MGVKWLRAENWLCWFWKSADHGWADHRRWLIDLPCPPIPPFFEIFTPPSKIWLGELGGWPKVLCSARQISYVVPINPHRFQPKQVENCTRGPHMKITKHQNESLGSPARNFWEVGDWLAFENSFCCLIVFFSSGKWPPLLLEGWSAIISNGMAWTSQNTVCRSASHPSLLEADAGEPPQVCHHLPQLQAHLHPWGSVERRGRGANRRCASNFHACLKAEPVLAIVFKIIVRITVAMQSWLPSPPSLLFVAFRAMCLPHAHICV